MAKLSKKRYEEIASLFRDEVVTAKELHKEIHIKVMKGLIVKLSSYFKQQDDNFNEMLFWEQCGIW